MTKKPVGMCFALIFSLFGFQVNSLATDKVRFAYISDSPGSSAESLVKAVAEAVHFFKHSQQETIKIMSKYTRGQKPDVLEGSWSAYNELLEADTHLTLEGLNDTLAVQADWDPNAASAKAENLVDLRFVKKLRKNGFLEKLYGGHKMSKF